MAVTTLVRTGLVVVACLALGACSPTGDGGEDCVSDYEPVAQAATWPELKSAMPALAERGRVASVRTQARGDDVGAGHEDAVRVVDLLDEDGRRLVQAEVWRTVTGGWAAGVWGQCLD